jgi:allantoicase
VSTPSAANGWTVGKRAAAANPVTTGQLFDWGYLVLVRGVVIDTSFYTGNYPERASIDACDVEGVPSPDALTSSDVEWWPLLAPVDLVGNAPNDFAVDAGTRAATHVASTFSLTAASLAFASTEL